MATVITAFIRGYVTTPLSVFSPSDVKGLEVPKHVNAIAGVKCGRRDWLVLMW
jgi:hypothetical protein